jgi:alanine dehydrogenase
LTRQLLDRKVTGIAYETITDRNGGLPLLTPMSEVAGRMAIQVGAHYLEKMSGGRGILLGGVPGVPAARVVILGGGVVGTNAAKIAVGMGAHVTIIDNNLDRLRELDDIFLSKISTLASSAYMIQDAISQADLIVGAVLVKGAGSAETGHQKHAEGSSERRCDCRRRGRSRRLHRDHASDHSLKPDLLRRGSVALLRRKHARAPCRALRRSR